jgi:hypothetical protein
VFSYTIAFRQKTYQSDQLDAESSKLGLELGESAELGGADGREVIRVREEHGPAVADELVEVDGTVGGLRIEVGGSRAQAEATYTCERGVRTADREGLTERVQQPLCEIK